MSGQSPLCLVLAMFAVSPSLAWSNDQWSIPSPEDALRTVTMTLANNFEAAVAKSISKTSYRKGRAWSKDEWAKGSRRAASKLRNLPCNVKQNVERSIDWLACNRNCFYAEGEVWFVSRNNTASDQPVVIDTLLPPGSDVLLRVSDLEFDNQPGYRAMVGYEVDECTAIEVAYLDLDWNSQAVRDGVNNLAIPGDLGLISLDFFDADRMQVDYSSSLQSIEANLIKKFCHANLLAGLRQISLDESFNIHPNDPMTGMSDYNIATQNDLYGAQVGIEFDRQCGIVGLDAVVKAGVYANDAEQRQFVMDFPLMLFLRDFPTQGPVRATGTRAAFLGEIGISGTVDLTCNLTLRAGYNMIWIDGVALAPDHLDFTNTPASGTALLTGGSLFLHGASVGIEGRF